VIVRVGLLERSEIGPAFHDKTVGIEQPAVRAGLRRGHAVLDQRRDEQVGDADRRLAGSKEKETLLAQGYASDAP